MTAWVPVDLLVVRKLGLVRPSKRLLVAFGWQDVLGISLSIVANVVVMTVSTVFGSSSSALHPGAARQLRRYIGVRKSAGEVKGLR